MALGNDQTGGGGSPGKEFGELEKREEMVGFREEGLKRRRVDYDSGGWGKNRGSSQSAIFVGWATSRTRVGAALGQAQAFVTMI